MEEVKSTTTAVTTDFAASTVSKYEGLVDIPLNQKIIDSLIKLFNYLDIYGPKMPLVYTIVTAFRFLQLIGGSFMAANHNVFKPGTLSYDVMGVITIFFHLLPVEYRRGNGFLIQIIFDLLLILMAFYLIVTAFRYKSTSKVPYISTLILTIFMAIGPFLFVPIVAQYAAQTTSGLIRGVTVPDAQRVSSIILTCIAILLWMWIIIAAYTKSLVFRPCSFASVQGTPQTKLYITTTVVTFASALTTNLPQYYSAGCMVVSFLLYIYSATTVFRCGTFIKTVHQALILTGSIIGMVLCGVNLYPILTRTPWGPEFFVGFAALFVITYISCYFYIRGRQRGELKILDEINDTNDIKVISVGKFKQMVVTGFAYSHPVCLSYRFFKLAIEEWRDELDVYSIYAMFAAIYPDQAAQLTFICQYVSGMKTDNKTVQSSILSSASNILKSRETNYTQDLKRKIAKLNKYFNKTKIKLRNVWDLILQGNIIETNQAIKRTKTSVEECGVEMAFLLMQYPNNRFVARQNIIYLNDIKCDPIQTKVAIDNLHKLQRGVSVVPDTVQNLGMEAFPNLPEFCAASTDASINDGQATESESLVGEDMYSEDSLDFEAIGTITKQIERHDVPAINYIIWSTIAYLLIIIVLPLIAGIVYFPFFSHELQEPVTIIEGIARTRTTLSVLTGYIGRFIFRMVDDPYNPGHPIQEGLEVMPGFTFEAFGGNTKSRAILRYCATEISETNGDMAKLRAFKPGNKRMEQIRKMLFSNIINFTFYINRTNFKKYLSSVSDISYMLANHIGKLCDLPVIDAEVVKGSDSMTARNNNNGSLTTMGVALEVMALYLEDLNQNFRITFFSILGALCGLSFFGYITIYTIQAKKLRHNRKEILFVLTTLPKTVISNVSASFSKLNKGDSQISESELEGNRQEDSIIKLFASISDGSAHASIESVIALLIALIVVLSCLSYFIVISYFISSSKAVVAKSIHINHLFGCAAYLYGVLSTVFKIALAFYHPMFKDSLVSFDNEVNNIRTRIPTITEYFQRMRLGNPDQGQRPYDGMERAVKYANSFIYCKDKLTPPTRVFDSIHCFSATQQLFITTAVLKKYLAYMTDKDPIYPNPSEKTLSRLWQIGPIELYETFFYRAGKEIVPTIIDSIEAQFTKVIRAAVLFILATGILSLLIVYCAKRENEFLHFCLKLFLRCPPMAILSNQRVMNLMSGNYNIKFDESVEKHSQFSEQIVDKLDGVVIVADEETRKIYSVNIAFVKMFGIEAEEAEKMNVNDFLVESRFKCEESLEKVYTTMIEVQYTKNDGDLVYMQFSSVLVANRRIFFGTNQTQNVMHEKLIAHEKEKSDRMLASILPASLVPRVQAGEKNISFSVQSVTVLFLDIVSFTPWCGSHDAQYVMRMLNIMFKEFDAITNAHKTMTKIKCIGDCYMAAGGIFDEVNQPAVHSREVVDFGCMVIKKLREIDEKENENLQIRVGVNTGGPIVAGVIGTEKPTFEILGPAINIAHEMEHHGVAMKVHISRPVYELIYGQQFDIKERGEIDVKGGKMFTYLVEP